MFYYCVQDINGSGLSDVSHNTVIELHQCLVLEEVGPKRGSLKGSRRQEFAIHQRPTVITMILINITLILHQFRPPVLQ